MATRASAGVRPGVFVLVILVAVASWVVWFMMYARKFTAEQNLSRVRAEIKELKTARNKIIDTRFRLKFYFENKKDNAEDVKAYFDENAKTMPKVVANPRNYPNVIAGLDLWNARLKLLADRLDDRIVTRTALADGAELAREKTREEYETLKKQRNTELSDIGTTMTNKLAERQTLLDKYTKQKTAFVDQFTNLQLEWDDKKKQLNLDIKKAAGNNAVISRDLKLLRPEPSVDPPSGRIVRSDWRTNRAVIDLGTKDHAFPGLVFEVYYFNTKGQRIVKGKVEVFRVMTNLSHVTIIEKQVDNPILAGDAIQTQFKAIPGQKKFVIAGYFAEDAIYNEEQLKAIIELNGGVVQENVDLFTDVLILGEMTISGAGDIAEAGVAAAHGKTQTGRAEAEVARELSIDVVGYREFLASIRR